MIIIQIHLFWEIAVQKPSLFSIYASTFTRFRSFLNLHDWKLLEKQCEIKIIWSYCYTFTCTWALARCGGLGETPGFFLLTAGEPFVLKLKVRNSGGRDFELWDTTEEESSTSSPPMADRQLRSELLNRLMHSPDDSVLSTEAETMKAEVGRYLTLTIFIQLHFSKRIQKCSHCPD